MRSFTSSSEARFVVALALTFCVLATGWEVVLRRRGSAAVDVTQMNGPALDVGSKSRGELWVLFGNCLVMTGVSPRLLTEQLASDPERERTVVNIAGHEQSPIAFFEYLKREGRYPDVIISNVSSWLNGTNFEQEGDLVTKQDPLSLGSAPRVVRTSDGQQAYKQDAPAGSGAVQASVEASLTQWSNKHVQVLGHRYHLFDYGLFLAKLTTTADLDASLYQLGMQSWFRVLETETDGRGYLGFKIEYRADWAQGLEQMADRVLQRLRLSRLLTPRYWSLLEGYVREFQSHGTRVLFVRMPEHPRIRAFNDEAYELTSHLHALEQAGAPVLDLSRLGPADGVRLFDAVHPDAAAAEVITREIGAWPRARAAGGGLGQRRRTGGG